MKIKILNLAWDVTLLRFYLMMFLVITGVLTQIWAIAFLSLPVFLSAILGVSFEWKGEKVNNTNATAKMVSFGKGERNEKKVG